MKIDKLLVVKKFSSHKEAEESDDEYWRNTTSEERLDEWSRLFNMYCSFQGLDVGEGIKKVVKKKSRHAF